MLLYGKTNKFYSALHNDCSALYMCRDIFRFQYSMQQMSGTESFMQIHSLLSVNLLFFAICQPSVYIHIPHSQAHCCPRQTAHPCQAYLRSPCSDIVILFIACVLYNFSTFCRIINAYALSFIPFRVPVITFRLSCP